MSSIPKFGFACLISLCLPTIACADAPAKSLDWRGFYLGASTGAVWSTFNANTTTQAGSLLDTVQANAVNQAGNQTLSPNGFLAGVTGGYNWQINHFLIGVEGDIQSLSISDSTYTDAIAYPNLGTTQFVLTAYGYQNWLLTARPRVGFITDSGLFYATGGLAVTFLQSDFVFSNTDDDLESQRVRKFKPGYVIGGGYEAGLTNNVSMKLEYLYTYFGTTNAANMNQNIPAGQTFTNSVKLYDNVFRVGFNYHFNDATSLSPQLIPQLFDANEWKVEIGVRPFYSFGTIGAPQPLLNDPDGILASRLIYKNLGALSLEAYTRLDHDSGMFVKGLLGAGTINDGQLNDEDFPAGGAYSNTLSNALGNLSYGTADIGYSVVNTQTGKTGLFVGYNYYAQNVNAYGCQQLANAGVCVPSTDLNNFLVISEDNSYKSLRIGIVSQFDITDRISFSAEAAYLPIVNYAGQDNHNARQLILPEQSNTGDGSMLESTLSYQFSDSWNIGVGARYWMWNMHNGISDFNFLADDEYITEPARFSTYRYGAFLQLSYLEKPANHIRMTNAPVAWQGLYVGGNLGGSWGNTDWPDPFGPSESSFGKINAAGFGDDIYSTGPLGSVDIHYYWQFGRLVLGVGGNAGVADIRGEDTLFSGMGGVNGQAVTSDFFTLVGKIGIANDRSLFYFNLGPAMLSTKYNINANTDEGMLGAQSQTISDWGATVGAGLEYALTENVTTSVEYDYIFVPVTTVYFSDIDIINEYSYSVNQSMNMVKVGLNYKFW